MIAGKNVVVTGVIAGHSRITAEAALREAGAFVQSSVTGSTDLLVIGDRVGATKINKADDLGVQVVSWEDLWNGGGASTFGPGVQVIGAYSPRYAGTRQVAPMLCKTDSLPTNGDGSWVYEVKWDGYRCVATVHDGMVHMASRSAKTEYANSYPAVAEALSELPDCVLDGELVVFEDDGTHSFGGMKAGRGATFVIFDMLEGPNYDQRSEPWFVRRETLEALLAEKMADCLTLSPVFDDGEALLKEVAERGLEGVVAKKRSSTYREGSREAWVKVKVRNSEEFVVVGWTPGKGSRSSTIGALLLATADDTTHDAFCSETFGTGSCDCYGDPQYVGKVGTGGTLADWEALADRLTPSPKPTVDIRSWTPADKREANRVLPEVVVQVQFQRWTKDGRLWHPSLLGVREDKS